MNGFVNLLKPPGMTSHDVVQCVRKTLQTRSVGHTGTLDPAAAGVLVLTVGQATRLGEYLLESDKKYRAEITLGLTTDSGDAEGVVTRCASAANVSEARLRTALAELTGTISMRPPTHSAVRVDGKRLYKSAHAGKQVEAPERTVVIREMMLLEFHPAGPEPTARVLVDVTCSKGTYIRSLAQMLGEKLGCGGYLSMLLRIAVAGFTLDTAVTLEELAQDPAGHLTPAREALPHLPQPTFADQECDALRQGQTISMMSPLPTGPLLVYNGADELICLAEASDGILRPRKVFAK
ncbi:MAG: tRNA pseudouridine(55) synthase TruB [Armatimonadota bacterium]